VSHYTSVKTKFKDKDLLVAALKELYVEVEVHNEPVKIHGYGGAERLAEIVVRKRYANTTYADVGFKRQPNGTYELVVDDLDFNRLGGQRWLGQLAQKYGTRAVIRTGARKGMRIHKTEKLQDGTFKMTLRRSG